MSTLKELCMADYKKIKQKLIDGNYPTQQEICGLIKEENIYRTSIIITLLFEKLKEDKCLYLKNILNQFPLLTTYLLSIYTHNDYYDECVSKKIIDYRLICLLKYIINGNTVEIDSFRYAMSLINSRKADPEFISIFLIEVYTKGLCDEDIYNLTLAMCETGTVYDYRGKFGAKKLARRYPTGAVSEKTALILPSMIVHAAENYPIVSSFLVAKSLSFTGGTWDKLNVIPGFVFPLPGVNTYDVIQKCGVAMTVAQSDLCPVDTILYQIRSMTDTVDAIPLAASSIASKQLACPPDLLLLDVRYGEGAFFNYYDAQKLCNIIEQILLKHSINVISIFTSTDNPSGSSIGNRLEICEAISIINNCNDDFNSNLKKEQMDIIACFFAKMMENIYSDKTFKEWYSEALLMIEKGTLKTSFENLLSAHYVSNDIIYELFNNPMKCLNLNLIGEVNSNCSGKITKINQKKLGDIVNFGINLHYDMDLNKPVNEMLFSKENDSDQLVNLLLLKQVGDYISNGEPIVKIYSTIDKFSFDETFDQLCNNIYACFMIEKNT